MAGKGRRMPVAFLSSQWELKKENPIPYGLGACWGSSEEGAQA